MNDEQQYIAVSVASKMTGIPERTIRHWVTSGKLAAMAGERGRLVRLDDVYRLAVMIGKLPGPLPGFSVAETVAGTTATSPGNLAGETTVADIAPSTERQLEVIRDTLLRPQLEVIERQQERIAELEREAGRMTAERDALQRRIAIQEEAAILEREQIQAERDALEARVHALQVRRRSAQDTTALRAIERDATPQTATETRQKPRQRRWWLRLFGVDE